jgi:hypothetical protein
LPKRRHVAVAAVLSASGPHATLTLLLVGLFSFVVSSDRLGYDDRHTIAAAVDILERAGFAKEVFVLRHLVTYRGTDNWWNRYVGHQSAYAATNFPFEVRDGRALLGAWVDKARIGWTEDRYGQTRAWKNT